MSSLQLAYVWYVILISEKLYMLRISETCVAASGRNIECTKKSWDNLWARGLRFPPYTVVLCWRIYQLEWYPKEFSRAAKTIGKYEWIHVLIYKTLNSSNVHLFVYIITNFVLLCALMYIVTCFTECAVEENWWSEPPWRC